MIKNIILTMAFFYGLTTFTFPSEKDEIYYYIIKRIQEQKKWHRKKACDNKVNFVYIKLLQNCTCSNS